MPFVLIVALVINGLLQSYDITGTPNRLIFLSASFPLGFAIGRMIYMRKSHVEIMFDNVTFRSIKGSRETVAGLWRSYKFVSIVLDRYGRPDLRLYKTLDGEYVDLPISQTNADPQGLRDYVQELISAQGSRRVNPQAVEVA